MSKLMETAERMTEITQKYLDKLSPQERERRMKDFKRVVTLRPTGIDFEFDEELWNE